MASYYKHAHVNGVERWISMIILVAVIRLLVRKDIKLVFHIVTSVKRTYVLFACNIIHYVNGMRYVWCFVTITTVDLGKEVFDALTSDL